MCGGDRLCVIDRTFAFFAGALILIVALFGVATFVIAGWGDHALALRMLNVFAGMFSAVVGLGAGFLLGRTS